MLRRQPSQADLRYGGEWVTIEHDPANPPEVETHARVREKPEVYSVIFDPECRGCKFAQEIIEPATVYDVSLCEFPMTVSGIVETGRRGTSGTLRVRRVDKQPTSRTKDC